MLRALAVIAAFCFVSACGGGDDGGAGALPTLAHTPIPTVASASPAPDCDSQDALPVPPGVPADVSLPPELRVTEVATSPHLRLVGIASPPQGDAAPPAVVAGAMLDAFRARGWSITRDPAADGEGYDFASADGRQGSFLVQPFAGCEGKVLLTVELRWIVD